jgi:ATP-dependent RNA helicase DDX47/RRP3
LDEADRLLDMEFTEALDKILKLIPRERTTYLYSATMTTKVAKLQRASLTNPVRVEVSSKWVTSFQNPFLVLTYLDKIPNGVNFTAVLSAHAIERKGTLFCLFDKYTGAKFNYRFYSNKSRRSKVIDFPFHKLPLLLTLKIRLSIILRILGFAAVPIHGDMSQSQRLGALGKFKSGSRKVLVATDIASR